MKIFQAFVSTLVGGLVLSLAAGAHAQSDSKPGYATIVRIEGTAQYSAGDNVWHTLTVGQTLAAGNVIQTAHDSKVDIVLGDKFAQHIVPTPDRVSLAPDSNVRDMISYKATSEQNVIRMMGDTVLAVDKLLISNTGVDAVSDTELDLRQGTIFGNVKKLSAASQYLIKTPNGIAGVRGTTFMMSANGAITVINGSMEVAVVSSSGTSTVTLGPGDQLDPVTGQVTHLTTKQLSQQKQTAVFVTTVVEGIISFADDRTLVFVSPVNGNLANLGHPAWPF
jgi:hypothetical protein